MKDYQTTLMETKDERGTPDHRGSPNWTMQPKKNRVKGPVFCFIWGPVRVWRKGTSRDGVSFLSLSVQVFFFLQSGDKF